jgi:hypothetical protein
MHRRLLTIALLLVPPSLWAGGLTFDETLVDLTAGRGAGKAFGEFRFTNTSDQPIRLRSVPASCGCIVARPEKRDYAPGERGVIPFAYGPKGKDGTHSYRVYVVTNEKGRPYELLLRITEQPAAPEP